MEPDSSGSSETGKRRPTGAARRGAARLLAVQAVYQVELTGGDAEAVAAEFLEHRVAGDDGAGMPPDRAFFGTLVRGVARDRAATSALIDAALSDGWSVARLEVLLAAILHCGAYELAECRTVPVRVIISEYVNLAHAFFGGREPAMTNGVLDTLARQLRPGELEVPGVEAPGLEASGDLEAPGDGSLDG